MLEQLRAWAGALKRDMLAVWLAARDPRVPWYVKGLGLAVATYALTPIDLIPDFIPVLGYIDDLIILPLGILLVVRLVPPHLMDEFRATAALRVELPRSYIAPAVIVSLWAAAIGFVLLWLPSAGRAV